MIPCQAFLRHSIVQGCRTSWRRQGKTSTLIKKNFGSKQKPNDATPWTMAAAGGGGLVATLLFGNHLVTEQQNLVVCEKASKESNLNNDTESNNDTTMGVEFRQPPNHIEPIDPPLHDFFSKQIRLRGGLPVRCHECVSDAALWIAADRLSFMLRYLPDSVIERLVRRGASFHIVGIKQNTSCLPEHSHMKGVPGGYTGEDCTVDERTRGMGGVHSSCGEENLIDLDADPRYSGKDILVHEFAHCVMDVGLPISFRDEIKTTWKKAVDKGLWTREDGTKAYAGTNEQEYFAELSMWYFGTRGEFVDKSKRLPSPGPGGLRDYDKDGFELLTSIYSGSHPLLQETKTAPHPFVVDRLKPLAEKSNTEEITQRRVSLEFDNRGCDRSWKLYWIPDKGKREPYGNLLKGETKVQETYPGHVWELELDQNPTSNSGENTHPSHKVLQYVATHTLECQASVAEDSDCRTSTNKPNSQ